MDDAKAVKTLEIIDGSRPVNEGRRETLVRMGKFVGLTSPAVVLLLTSESGAAWAGSGPVVRPPRPRRPPRPPRPRR